MRDGYFLSIYAHVCPIAAAYAVARRHDQAMALWRRAGNHLTLVRYWEFERLTGVKGHALSFPDEQSAYAFISEALASEGLTLDDLFMIVGTPGLSAPNENRTAEPKPVEGAAYHSLCHLYSGLTMDAALFQEEKILCLALDAGPDHVIDQDAWNKPHYLGAFSDRGNFTTFKVSSPAILWALLRERCGLAEGTLMALGSASTVAPALNFPPPPVIASIDDRFAASDWLADVAERLDHLAMTSPEAFRCPQGRFSANENRIAAMVKVVHDASFGIVARTIEGALERFGARPGQVHLSMVGGFALNCAINGRLMRHFGFKGFVAPPVVNDCGIALGMGLHHALQHGERIDFRLGTAFHGRQHAIPNRLDGVRADPAQVVDDLLEGPILWFDGPSEIGPRALGHRSLLADPRNLASKDRLNRIKDREWWRPVAPIVLAACAADWFELDGPSPFMLQAVPVRPHRREMIPAICHLDGTARVQTLTDDEDPALAAVLRAFHARTGVPIVCNTSLNAKGEPIIDDMERALSFAREKEIAVAYLNGRRVVLDRTPGDAPKGIRERDGMRHFQPPALTPDWLARHNPQNLTARELTRYFSDPRLAAYDFADAGDVRILRRLFTLTARRRGAALESMLAPIGTNRAGAAAD